MIRRQRQTDGYRLEAAEWPVPDLPGRVSIATTADEVIDKLAADLVLHAQACVREFGDFHLALSGGSPLIPLYERLMIDPDCRALPWRRTHLWVVDERCVSFDDERSNYRMIHETIVEHSDIPRDQVHPIPVTGAEADVQYERDLRETLGWREKGQDRLDYVLLNLGTSGEVAGLFPGRESLAERRRLVVADDPPDASLTRRVSMSFALINAARFIAILVTGAAMASLIERISRREASTTDLPALGLQPLQGQLWWYVDGPACGGEVQ